MDKSLISRLAFWQKTIQGIDVGVYIDTHHLWVYTHATDAHKAHCLSFECKNNQWQDGFTAIAKHFPHARLHLVFAASFYQILVADKPNVDTAELPQALLWSIKDMVSMDLAQIHLDYFEPPIASNKVNVVVTERDKLINLLQVIDEQGLQVIGISIEELAITNHFVDDAQARLVVSHQTGQELLLTVVKQGQLYMQRRVRGFIALDKAQVDDLNYGLADTLSLEIQRSMDYFESQLRQAPVASIELLTGGATDALATLVSANFNQAVNVIAHQGVGEQFARLAFAESFRVA